MREYLTQVTQVRPLTMDILELDVELIAPSEMSYVAGQFMEFKIGSLYRCYSIVNAPVPDNPMLTFLVKLEPHGVGSDFVRNLKVGSEVVMRGPNGFFTVDDFNQPTFFVASGVGIAPFAAMIPDMLVRGFKPEIHLLFGVRSEEDVFYYDRFNQLAKQYPNFKFIPILSRPLSHWPGETGYVTTYLEISHPQHQDFMFFLCGSPTMVNDARQVLLKAGHEPKKVRTEIFA